jgi:hypothetical protein
LGIGDWGWGIGDWAQSPSPIPNPQSPIPNPHFILFTKINYIKRSKQLIINKDKSLNIFIDK